MGLPDENRQCGICDQMVPSHTKGIEILQFGKRRVFHEGCAKLVSESYKKHMDKLKLRLLDPDTSSPEW